MCITLDVIFLQHGHWHTWPYQAATVATESSLQQRNGNAAIATKCRTFVIFRKRFFLFSLFALLSAHCFGFASPHQPLVVSFWGQNMAMIERACVTATSLESLLIKIQIFFINHLFCCVSKFGLFISCCCRLCVSLPFVLSTQLFAFPQRTKMFHFVCCVFCYCFAFACQFSHLHVDPTHFPRFFSFHFCVTDFYQRKLNNKKNTVVSCTLDCLQHWALTKHRTFRHCVSNVISQASCYMLSIENAHIRTMATTTKTSGFYWITSHLVYKAQTMFLGGNHCIITSVTGLWLATRHTPRCWLTGWLLMLRMSLWCVIAGCCCCYLYRCCWFPLHNFHFVMVHYSLPCTSQKPTNSVLPRFHI